MKVTFVIICVATLVFILWMLIRRQNRSRKKEKTSVTVQQQVRYPFLDREIVDHVMAAIKNLPDRQLILNHPILIIGGKYMTKTITLTTSPIDDRPQLMCIYMYTTIKMDRHFHEHATTHKAYVNLDLLSDEEANVIMEAAMEQIKQPKQ